MDPIHDRPPALTVEGLQHDLQSMHGRFLHHEHTDPDSTAGKAWHEAVRELSGLLWPGRAA